MLPFPLSFGSEPDRYLHRCSKIYLRAASCFPDSVFLLFSFLTGFAFIHRDDLEISASRFQH